MKNPLAFAPGVSPSRLPRGQLPAGPRVACAHTVIDQAIQDQAQPIVHDEFRHMAECIHDGPGSEGC